MERMHEVIDTVVEAGKIMLECGSEIYRSEETMIRMANSYGIKDIDIFTLATCIYVTCVIEGETYTRIKRTYPKSTDLTKISRINQLSREMGQEPISIDEFKMRLSEIDQYKRPKRIVVASTMALTSAVFAYMLQSCAMNDFWCTAFVGFIAYYIYDLLNHHRMHSMLKNLLVTMAIAIMAIAFVETGIGTKIDDIIIGGIMLLVPGVATTNAVRDTLMGDILSGMIRVLEALTAAIGIAMGAGLVLYFYHLVEALL